MRNSNLVLRQTKKPWIIINDLLKPSHRKSKFTIKSIIYNNQTYERDSDVAGAFNSHFVSIGGNINSSFEGV